MTINHNCSENETNQLIYRELIKYKSADIFNNKIYNLLVMDSLLNSRRTKQGNQEHVKLENLSPEKYGKAAFADLTYTPSKLADNYLYREVTTLKKTEEGNSKLRQFQAINSVFHDRLEQLKQERDGIEQSLTSQIKMYKKLLAECESKNEIRIKDIQSSFKEQMRILIAEKQEEAKYAQSQKQLLENRIEELEEMLTNLKYQLDHSGNQHDDLKNQKQKLDIQFKNISQKLAETETKMKEDSENAKKNFEELSRKFYNAEVNWKSNLESQINKKNKEIQNLERLQRSQLEKIENKRSADNLMKNQEIKDLTNTFESESKRLGEIIGMKDRMVENLNKDLSKEKQVVLELTRSYEKQINDLSHDKNRLLDEIDQVSHQNTKLTHKINDQTDYFEKQRMDLECYIRKLKDELELDQVNFVREKDRNAFFATDLQRQISALRIENSNLGAIQSENELLSREVRNLRELLLESSNEMQKCKEEFIKMGKQRDVLLYKMREVGCENDALYRIKVERQEEARSWKDSYYMSKRY